MSHYIGRFFRKLSVFDSSKQGPSRLFCSRSFINKTMSRGVRHCFTKGSLCCTGDFTLEKVFVGMHLWRNLIKVKCSEKSRLCGTSYMQSMLLLFLKWL